MPPIVLFVENDADTLDMYSTYFERASHELRARSERVRGRTAELMERSQALFSRAEAIDGTLETAARRRCPHCGNPLTWIERGALGDRDFDYYTWCTHGCGLYCFDRGSNKWVKLA